MVPCYASTTRQYRHQMAGSPDAGSLPKPSGSEGIEAWGTAKSVFDQMMSDINDGLRAAEAAHVGRAADAANASINEIKPHMERVAEASGKIKSGLEHQVSYQSKAFASLPSEGETLPNGREVQLDPPQKGWVENAGLDDNPITGWMSDYEERQEDFRATNERAQMAMDRYKSQTESNLASLPHFEDDAPAKPSNQPAPGTGMSSANDQMAGTGYSGTPTVSGGAVPASSSSAWASTPSGGGPQVSIGGGTPSVPAGTTPAWSESPLPPGDTRGPGGTPYRQAPNARDRQNQQNNRWAPVTGNVTGAPPGSGGAARMAGGTSGVGNVGGANQMSAGGRAGVGGMGGGASAGTAGGAAPGTSARGGAMGPGAGARGAHGGAEDEEHERPSWLVENEDVFTNDMQRVAPPVLGERPRR